MDQAVCFKAIRAAGPLEVRSQKGCPAIRADSCSALERKSNATIAWAARLTPDGHDLLAYRTARSTPAQSAPASAPKDGLQQVKLRPAEMTALAYGAEPPEPRTLRTLTDMRDLHTLGAFIRRAEAGDEDAPRPTVPPARHAPEG